MALISFKSLKFTTGIVGLLTLAGSAQATLLSFASDDDSGAFTFRGTAASGTTFNIRNARDPLSNPVTLKIDDNNNALPTLSLNVGFLANFTANWEGSVGMAAFQTHVYRVAGSFSFVNPTTGAVLLTGDIGGTTLGGMTISGSNTAWGSAGGIFNSDSAHNFAGAVVWTATPALFTYAQSQGINNLALYGVASAGSSLQPDDFSFTLTNLNTNGSGVPINSTSRLPSSAWNSEGSFSGTALNGIPTPGAIGLAAAGLLVVARRRRS